MSSGSKNYSRVYLFHRQELIDGSAMYTVMVDWGRAGNGENAELCNA